MRLLSRLALSGWKSIRDADLPLGPLNVFIGANGAGKSNLISFFKLLNEMIGGRLQAHVARAGGASTLLHRGPKQTAAVVAALGFDSGPRQASYGLRLAHAAGDTLVFAEERAVIAGGAGIVARGLGAGHRESRIADEPEPDKQIAAIREHVAGCRVYQFHDTSETARLRQAGLVEDNRSLQSDAGNLAAFLYRLRLTSPPAYRRIVATVRQVAPFFDDFALAPRALNERQILLEWREKGNDTTFGPHQLSDGTLRAIALVALLLQPEAELPATLLIDEPELGLHPYALGVLAALIRKAAHHCQVIVATQSAALLRHFESKEVVVVERDGADATTFRRLDAEALVGWLDDSDLGAVWEKNVLGGGPH